MGRIARCMMLFACFSIIGFGIAHAADVLFEDNFGGGNFAKWDVPKDMASHWTIEKNILGSSALGKGLAYMSVGDQKWSDYTLKTRVKITEGTFEIAFRTGAQGRYFMHYDAAKKQIVLMKNKPWSTQTSLVSAGAVVPSGQWTDIAISVAKGVIKVSVAGTPTIEFTDKDPLLAGGIQVISIEKSVIGFSDVNVTKLAD